jgi:Zn-dependent protease/CBS domain-containing protein
VPGTAGVRLGRIFGIQVTVDPSWIFIALLLTWSLTAAFGRWHPEWPVTTAFLVAVVATVLFFGSVLLHELAHSIVAKQFGIPVDRITLFLLGGVSNIEREPSSPKVEFATAVVGPLTSISIGLTLLVIASLMTGTTTHALDNPAAAVSRFGPFEALLMWLGPVNIAVGVFNLVPGFPLDGGRILRAAIWAGVHDLHVATRIASIVGMAIGWLLVLLGVAMAFGAYVPFLGRGLIAGLWLAFIGWFLSAAASQTWRRQLAHEMLEGVDVSRLMRPPGAVVRAETTVAAFVNEWLMRSEERAFPVVQDAGRIMGLVTITDVRRIPRASWAATRVADIMTPSDRLITVVANEDGPEALEKLIRRDVSQLPVLDGDRLVGMLYRHDLARWIELHVEASPSRRRFAH